MWYDGWESRNRNTGRAWSDVRGVMIHHTVTRDVAPSVHIVRDLGQGAAVPPPLYNGLVDKCGTLHVIGWGRANHAGKGDGDVLAAVTAERATPHPNEADTDGNAHFYGFAGINMGDGKDAWPGAQLATLAAVSAAVCRHHKWNRNSVIGHREWQPGKVDPRGPGGSMMPRIRGLVHEELR